MTYAIEFGKCRALYGCVGRTAVEAFSTISKMKCITSLVMEGSTSMPFSDVVVIDKVSTLIACKPYTNQDMVIVVCDSPVAISTLKNVIPYDYSGSLFNNFTLTLPKSISLKHNEPISVEVDNIDMVKVALNSLIETGILSDFNSITARMNAPARKQLRAILIDIFQGKSNYTSAQALLTSLGIDDKSFIDRLKTRYFKSLQQAVIYHVKGHSIEYVSSKYGIKDTYEITYFAKMIKGEK